MMRWKVVLEEHGTKRQVTRTVHADHSQEARAVALRTQVGAWYAVRVDRAGKR